MEDIKQTKEPAFKTYKRGKLTFCRCTLTNVETYATTDVKALHECKAKSIEILTRWINEIQLDVEPFVPGDENLFQDEIDLSRKLEQEIGEPVMFIEGSEIYYMSKSGTIYEYNSHSDEFTKAHIKNYKGRQCFTFGQKKWYIDTMQFAQTTRI